MIERIIMYSIQHKLFIGFGTLVLIALGIRAITRLPVDAVPDITNNQVQVITIAPTLATLEVERQVVPDAALHRSGEKGYLFMLGERDVHGMGFKRIEVVPGVSRDGFTAIGFLEPLPEGAEFAADKVHYLWSMLENSEHDH